MINKHKFKFFLALVVAGLGMVFLVQGDAPSGFGPWLALIGLEHVPTNLGPFVSCLKDNGVTFYGAFWCPHCQNQKALFGKAADALPYVECSTPDSAGQLQICKDKSIKGYPTWEFADGSRQSGEVPLKQLSEKTGCELPQ